MFGNARKLLTGGKGSFGIMRNKKALTLLAGLGLAAGLVGGTTTASAASADSFTDVPKDHWSYEALDYLAKEGVIEGMGDNTFQGGRTMTRYEMASIVAKAMQKGNGSFGDKAVLDKLEAEYASEIGTLKNQVNQNTKDIDDLKNSIAGKLSVNGFVRVQYDYDKYSKQGEADSYNKDNNRFYMSMNGAYKVNDNWKACFQLEKNSFYNNGHDHENESGSYLDDNGTARAKRWSGHDGNIQRIWVEGYNPQNGSWISVGRAWRGLGQQNVLFGTESDGFQFGIPVKGTNLTASGFWFSSTGAGTRESWYGAGTWGNVGHSAGINFAVAKNTKSKGDVYAKNTGHLPVWDSQTVQYDKAYVASGWLDVAKDVRFITDYAQTNADDQNNSLFLRLNYRNTDLQKKGSYQLYTRYYRFGKNGTISGDDEWGSLFYNGSAGSKGWIIGAKYVPWKNVEWETMFSKQKQIANSNNKRTLVRTQMDFHF